MARGDVVAFQYDDAPFKHNMGFFYDQGTDRWVPQVVQLQNTQGNIFYLDPTSGLDTYDGTSPNQAFKTLKAAYAAMTANQNDILYYLAGSSSLTLPAGDAAFDWNKALTHFIGVGAPTEIGHRARIFNTAGTLNEPMITISGNGCHWANIYGFNGVDDAGALTCISVTADYGSMSNCQFVGGGNATCAIDGASSLYMNGSANYTYNKCTFGAQSIAMAANGGVVLLGATAGGQNVFNDCRFHVYAGATSVSLVEALDGSSTDRWMEFNRCKFYNWGPNSLASAFVVPAAGNGRYYLNDCVGVGFDKWDANDRGVIYGNMGTPAGLDFSGGLLLLET